MNDKRVVFLLGVWAVILVFYAGVLWYTWREEQRDRKPRRGQ